MNISITLTSGQVASVVRDARAGADWSGLFAWASGQGDVPEPLRPLIEDSGYSRSTLRALLVLAAFPADGTRRSLTDVAKAVDFSPSTTHRYVGTWVAVGLLERDPDSRQYRRIVSSAGGAT
jgi:IclR helix-turn-helix domain